jgi:uncharacterized protein YbjT (DUF2867 family)
MMSGLYLVTGGTGKTGRRVAERLRAHDVAVRAVSRSTNPGFGWTDESGWDAVLDGVHALYLARPRAFGPRPRSRNGPRRPVSGESCCSPRAA